LVRRVVSSTDLPVGIKIRSGWRTYDRASFGSLIESLAAAGLSYITIHPRTVTQGFRDKADPEVVRDARERTEVPLIASGDVSSPSDASYYFEAGADGVMIGRALMGDPEWFSRYAKVYDGSPWTTYKDDPSLSHRHLDLAARHLDLAIAYYGEAKGVRDFRPHMSWYLKGLKGRAILHDRMFSISTRADAISLLDDARSMWLEHP
jgi:tRNA-dihydrouridine synthase